MKVSFKEEVKQWEEELCKVGRWESSGMLANYCGLFGPVEPGLLFSAPSVSAH